MLLQMAWRKMLNVNFKNVVLNGEAIRYLNKLITNHFSQFSFL